MTQSPIDAALAAYDLVPPVEVFALAAQGRNNRAVGVRTGAGAFIFKTYLRQTEAALRYEQDLLTWLAAQGLPFAVPAAVPTRAGDTLLRTPEGWAALMPFLAGAPVNNGQVAEVEAMGAGLATLHQALARYQTARMPSLAPCGEVVTQHADLARLTAEQIGAAATAEVIELLAWWQQEHDAVSGFVAGAYAELPWQIIHRDYDPSNTLVTDGRLTGVLDFEFAGRDARALDVASALKYTMRVWENADPWPIARALCRGYGSVQRLTDAEISALPWLTHVRDAAVTLLRLGPAVAARDGELVQVYLQQARNSALWLETNGERLIEIATEHMSERPQPNPTAAAPLTFDAVIARLAAQPAVAGLLTIGSTGSGALTAASDYDLGVILRDMPVPVHVALTTIDQRLTDVIFVMAAELEHLLGEGAAPERPQWAAEPLRRWLRSGQVRFDRTGLLGRAQAAAQATPTALPSDAERYAAWFSINYNWQQTRRMRASADPDYQMAVDLRLLFSVHDLWRFYFVIRQLPILGEKAQSRYLAEHDADYLRRFQAYLATADRDAKFQLYEQLAALTIAPLGRGLEPGATSILPDPAAPWAADSVDTALAFWQSLIE